MPHTTGTDNKQYQKAEEQIRDAFFSLLDTYNFDELTASQIIATSGVNRTTFYRHFRDKYDILEQIQKDALPITAEFQKMSGTSSKNLIQIITDLSQIKLLLAPQNRKKFLQLMRIRTSTFNLHHFMRKGFMRCYVPSSDSEMPEFERELFADIAFRTVMYQMEHGTENKKFELKSTLQSIVNHLP